jgi:GDP-L-fucose synthase
LYVEDAAAGILEAAERYNGDQPINLGTGEEVSISELANMVAKEVGFSGEFVWDTTKPNGQPRRCLDVTRAKMLFGFQAKHRLQQGIPKTVAWYVKNAHHLREASHIFY